VKPYPFQAADLKKLREHNYTSLINSGTGAGKTSSSLFAAREGGADVTLIIAPDQTHESAWLPTVPQIMGLEGRIIGNKNKATKEAMLDFELGYPGVYLVTPELFTRSDVTAWRGDMLIVDEAHKLANPGKAGQRKLGGYDSRDPEPLASRFEGKLMLSGTMLRNRFEYAWSHSRVLWPELDKRGQIAHDNFYLWQSDRMLYETITTGVDWFAVSWETYRARGESWGKVIDGVPHLGNPKTARKYLSEAEPGRWINEAPCVITHLKREECCEFHPNGFMALEEPLVKREVIALAPAQKKAVKELEAHMMTWLEDNPLIVDIPLTKATRIRQFTLGVPTVTYNEDGDADVSFAEDCVSPFYNRLEEFLLDEVPDENVVVFVDSQKFAAVVTARLKKAGISAFEFSGQTRKDRMSNAEQFGTKYRVVVGVIAAIAEGFDGLQKVSNNEVWLSSSTDETLNEQGRGRNDRIGQRKQVFRLELVDDLGLAEGRYSTALEKRLVLNRSLRKAA
jgi:hypothetical protein